MDRTLPATWRLGSDLLLLIGVAAVYAGLVTGQHYAFDAVSYWSAWHGGFYVRPWPEPLTYVYPPPLAQAMWPLSLLPVGAFVVLWVAVLIGSLVGALGRGWAGIALVLPFVAKDVGEGQIHSLLLLAIVLGFRWPATWSFVLLTKVTPGVGLLWFVVRREWRNLAIALGATALIAGASFALAPHLWGEWVGTVAPALHASNTQYGDSMPLLRDVGLVPRALIALVIVAVGAWRGWRWTVPAGAFVALPGAWIGGMILLLPAAEAALGCLPPLSMEHLGYAILRK